MPNFERVPREEAEKKVGTSGTSGRQVREYLGYLNQIGRGKAGRLRVSEGESVSAVRRRLSVAAKVANKDIVVRRTGEEVYFWLTSDDPRPRRRRRGSPPQREEEASPVPDLGTEPEARPQGESSSQGLPPSVPSDERHDRRGGLFQALRRLVKE